MVSPSEGNEVRREDGKESQCPIVASKRGNGPYRTPWSEGGAALWAQRRNHAEGIEPPSVSPQGNGSCEGQRHNVTSRMPLTGTSGSVGGLGGQPPRSTRPAHPASVVNQRVVSHLKSQARNLPVARS